MSDADPVPVIPTLAYANPQGAQPLGGRLEVVYHENGVTVTDPKSAATSPTLIKWVGITLLTLGGCAAILSAVLIFHDSSDLGHLISALLAMVCGTVCLLRSPGLKQPPRVVRIEAGRIYTTGCPDHDWISGSFRRGKFFLKPASTELRTLQLRYNIRIRYPIPFPYSAMLFPALFKDEAIWAVDLMNKALNGEAQPRT